MLISATGIATLLTLYQLQVRAHERGNVLPRVSPIVVVTVVIQILQSDPLVVLMHVRGDMRTAP